MSKEEKANELLERFNYSLTQQLMKKDRIKCAIICVDEILETTDSPDFYYGVKEELLKLKQ